MDVTFTPAGTDLDRMLETGEIAALIAADVPRCFLDGAPKVTRLFPDHEITERAYYQRTGIFPIMHTVVVRRELATQPEGLVALRPGG